MEPLLKLGIQVAGVSQLLLCVVSFAIPQKLKWSERTKDLVPLLRQMFYTYAIYILASHFFFGVISACFAESLLEGGVVELSLLVFMALWWTGRIICQFFFFDRTGIPETPFNKMAETILVLMFFCLVGVYWSSVVWILAK